MTTKVNVGLIGTGRIERVHTKNQAQFFTLAAPAGKNIFCENPTYYLAKITAVDKPGRQVSPKLPQNLIQPRSLCRGSEWK